MQRGGTSIYSSGIQRLASYIHPVWCLSLRSRLLIAWKQASYSPENPPCKPPPTTKLSCLCVTQPPVLISLPDPTGHRRNISRLSSPKLRRKRKSSKICLRNLQVFSDRQGFVKLETIFDKRNNFKTFNTKFIA